MGKGLTVSRYRTIDLMLFALILFIFEGVATTAATRWFPAQPYAVSVVPAVLAIVMMRWGPWAALHGVLGGLAYCLFSRAGLLKQYGLAGLATWRYGFEKPEIWPMLEAKIKEAEPPKDNAAEPAKDSTPPSEKTKKDKNKKVKEKKQQ